MVSNTCQDISILELLVIGHNGIIHDKMAVGVVFLALEDEEGKNNDGISFSSSSGPAWAGTERDYSYDEVGRGREQRETTHTTR